MSCSHAEQFRWTVTWLALERIKLKSALWELELCWRPLIRGFPCLQDGTTLCPLIALFPLFTPPPLALFCIYIVWQQQVAHSSIVLYWSWDKASIVPNWWQKSLVWKEPLSYFYTRCWDYSWRGPLYRTWLFRTHRSLLKEAIYFFYLRSGFFLFIFLHLT